VKFAPGEVLVRRYWRGGRVALLHLVRVAADDERGLRLWLPSGSPYWRLTGQDDGGSTGEAGQRGFAGEAGPTAGLRAPEPRPGEPRSPRLARHVWYGTDVMIWMPADKPYSVSWLWADGAFAGWQAHLEEPYVRWADRGCAGVDTADQILDVVVSPDRTWRWRDEEEFEARTGHPLYWAPAQAARIRATGDSLARLAEAGRFPFDGTWCGFRPDASWTVPALPHGYDRPRALAPFRDRSVTGQAS
jgi:hypothetical protein